MAFLTNKNPETKQTGNLFENIAILFLQLLLVKWLHTLMNLIMQM